MAKKKDKKLEINPGISYAGQIRVDLVRGGKIVKTIETHNSGELPLFNFIANCLAGKFYESLKPQFIHFFNVDDEQVTYIPTPFSSVGVEQYEGSSGEGSHCDVVFKYIVPFSVIPVGSVTTRIKLYNQTDTRPENYIAYFDLPNNRTIEGDGKSNVVVTWTMRISNQKVN